MRVNTTAKLKLATHRDELEAIRGSILGRRPDLDAEIFEDPEVGALGLPIWSSIVFSADPGHWPGVLLAVHDELEHEGLLDRFELEPLPAT